MKKTKQARRFLTTFHIVVRLVRDVRVAHDPYDNSIGGPNDYAYGM